MSVPTSPAIPLGAVLVVGGCGFLGRHIVRELLTDKSCTSIAVMSRRPFQARYDNVAYYIGDVTSPDQVQLVMEQVKPNVVFNTASPHAYIDHENAYQYFTINVDGNKNLLASAASIGTVRAYVYTSSGPIIAGSGGAYDHADETHPTLAVTRKGDPYHIAKALGDELVLKSNLKNGIRTACIRPTAQYGEGDEQMMVPTLNVLKKGITFLWMGDNKNDMDVVYVGHVARAHLLAAYGLLAGITNANAPKVDGESFNITDDEPHHPWDFFRLFWMAAGDKTPLSKVIMFPGWLVLFMAHSAEWITWSTSFGRKRPEFLKLERMEFVLYTRTYSISKIRERLGFVPWADQPYTSQLGAVRGAVADYLKDHPIVPPKSSSWPEFPFRLITETGMNTKTGLPCDHYCIKNAQLMALTHNTMFRALNAIYAQALEVQPGTQDAADFLSYCTVVYDFIHHHHLFEEKIYFPDIEKATGNSKLMEKEIREHRGLDAGLEQLRSFAETTHEDKYSGHTLRAILDSFAPLFQQHMDSEVGAILDLHSHIGSQALKDIYDRVYEASGHDSNIFKFGPFVLGCQDRNFLLDGQKMRFPEVSFIIPVSPIIPYAVDLTLAGRHRNLWRFNPSNLHGKPREPGVGTMPVSVLKPTTLVKKLGWKYTLFFLFIIVILVYYKDQWAPGSKVAIVEANESTSTSSTA